MPRVCLLVLVAFVISGCAAPRPASPRAPIALEAVPIQWSKGGIRKSFAISPEDWGRIRAHFEPAPETPDAERMALAAAIPEFERIAGAQTPTGADHGRYRADMLDEGQQDCVDESSNTTTYLHLLAQRGLLRHHEVLEPQWRTKYIVATHRTAAVRESATGRAYAVDSWWEDNGGAPLIKPLGVWRDCSEDPP